jgi:hypothetical protein
MMRYVFSFVRYPPSIQVEALSTTSSRNLEHAWRECTRTCIIPCVCLARSEKRRSMTSATAICRDRKKFIIKKKIQTRLNYCWCGEGAKHALQGL